jgi:hypothetical protein
VVKPADDFCEGVGHLDGVTWDRHLLDPASMPPTSAPMARSG